MIIDKLLEKYNVKYEDLTIPERETVNGWIETLTKGELTIEKIRENLHKMRDAVEQELAVTGNDNMKDAFLKARLRNYMLLDALLESPERARKQMETMLSGIVRK